MASTVVAYPKLQDKLGKFGMEVDASGRAFTFSRKGKRGAREVVEFDGRKYEEFQKTCESGFAKVMLMQWKVSTVDVYVDCFLLANKCFRRLLADRSNGSNGAMKALRGVIAKMDSVFSGMCILEKSVRGVDFYKYTNVNP